MLQHGVNLIIYPGFSRDGIPISGRQSWLKPFTFLVFLPGLKAGVNEILRITGYLRKMGFSTYFNIQYSLYNIHYSKQGERMPRFIIKRHRFIKPRFSHSRGSFYVDQHFLAE